MKEEINKLREEIKNKEKQKEPDTTQVVEIKKVVEERVEKEPETKEVDEEKVKLNEENNKLNEEITKLKEEINKLK